MLFFNYTFLTMIYCKRYLWKQVACLTPMVFWKLDASLMNIDEVKIDCWFHCQYKAYFDAQPELVYDSWMLLKENRNYLMASSQFTWYGHSYTVSCILIRLEKTTEKKILRWSKLLQHLLTNALDEKVSTKYAFLF